MRIKICGMTRKGDIAHAATIGVDAIGLIFYPESSRYVDIKQAGFLLQNLPVFVNTVAVFVNPTATLVHEVIKELPIQTLQFHGEESPDFCEQFRYPYIKAISAISSQAIIEAANQYPQAKGLLLDTPADSYGGTGIPFNWEIIPPDLKQPIILAGGLAANNVQSAIRSCMPYAVDVCSGVEVSPGIKDPHKMSQFVNSVGGKNE